MKLCKFDGIMIFIHGAIDFLLPKKYGLLMFLSPKIIYKNN